MSDAGTRRPVRYERTFEVRSEDIDALGHVNNLVYLRWVQEIAGEHWHAGASPEQVEGIAWVVLRHEIDYKRAAGPGETVLARTWVGEASGTRFERHVEIVRPGTGELLARARSVWCPLDRETGRPLRVGSSLHDPFYEPS